MSRLHSLGCARRPRARSLFRVGFCRRGRAIQPTNWNAVLIFLAFVLVTLGITYWAAQHTRTTKDFYAAGGGDHWPSERSRDRWRLYVGRLVPRHRRACLQLRLLRPHLFDRLSCRLAIHHVPDGRAVAQSRPVHLRRRCVLSPPGDADSRHGGDRHPGRRRPLSHRADGGSGTIDRTPVRSALSLGGRRGRRADGHLCHLWRHDRDHLGADHQGGAAAWRLDADGAPRAGAIRLRLQRADRQGGRGPREPREDPAARAAGGQPDQRDLARHGAHVRHRRSAAHPHALLHRRQRQGGAQIGVLGDHLHRLFLHPDLHHRLRRDRAGFGQPDLSRRRGHQGERCSAAATCRRSISPTPSAAI